jgi:hypothetical protein
MKIVSALKTMPSTRSLLDTPIKARPWIFTLKGMTPNFTYAAAPTFILLLRNPETKESPSIVQRLEPSLLVL